jgi:ribonucleoside-triphosphate reductase
MSESADSLASCCRLRNEISDNTFSYSLGAGGVSTGSINVITINLNRLVQDGRNIREEVRKVHKYQTAYRSIIQEFKDAGFLPVYDAGFISLDKQFLTIGINGMVEAAESQGIKATSGSHDYLVFVNSLLEPIYQENKLAKEKYGFMFNTEFVPAENLGVKNANWDRNDGYIVPREVYNSYFYAPEDESLNIVDKFAMHGNAFVKNLDGGSANHVNLDEHLTKSQYRKILVIAAILGTNYWTINVRNTVCNVCGHIDKDTHDNCPKCGSEDVDYATRIIGYLKRVSKFSEPRQKEEGIRYYAEPEKMVVAE